MVLDTLDSGWPSPRLAALLRLFVPPLVVPIPFVRKATVPAQHAFAQRFAIFPRLAQIRTERLGEASAPNNNMRRGMRPTILTRQRYA